MAVRITLKRSSIPNKRPSSQILDPGELALNTNALTPGLFFETDNDQVVKVGPTAVGTAPQTLFPSLGEMNFDTVTRELTIGGLDPITAEKTWLQIASPYLGGTNGYVVFVAPEFPTSTDAIDNNGQAAPFRTLNRAIIEVAKQSIVTNNESDEGKNNRFVIYVAPGICPIYNGPGLPLPVDDNPDNVPEFDVNFEATVPSQPDVLNLQKFNPEAGGLPLPRGTSILGMDLRKVDLRPTYVPTYKNPTTGEGTNQPTTSIVKWTGNSYLSQFSFRDKRSLVRIKDIRSGFAGEGLFVSSRAHCFGLNDRVFFEFAPGTDQRPVGVNSAGVLSGFYYTYPVDADTFYLSYSPITSSEANFIERVQLPESDQGIGYLATCEWEGRSHNRLRCLYPASTAELQEFYVKVQLAFPVFFNGRANQAEVVNPGETQIVGPAPSSISESLLSNTTDNASPYVQNVTVRSNYGLCGIEQNGKVVSGFKSALTGSFCVASLQNDPVAYEIYTTVQDPDTGLNETRWYTLQYATWASLPPAVRPSNPSLISREQQMSLLNNTDVVNIRYYFETFKAANGESFGLPNEELDFRHFAIRSSNNAFVQVDTGWTIGCAVGYWAFNGGRMTVTNSSTNFGLNALRSEGFYQIGSNSIGSETPASNTNFSFAGIRVPDRLTPRDTINFQSLELGGSIISVSISETDPLVQEILLGSGFQPINILPYSLAPGTAIYSASQGSVIYRAFFVDDGLPTVLVNGDGTVTLRVRQLDSSFPIGSSETNPSILNWTSPFIRRWLDPRNIEESSYSLILENTDLAHNSPSVGNVLRLNQSSSSSSLLLRPGVQLDPGSNGGWGRVFQVAYSESAESGNSPQYNEVLLNRNLTGSYYVSLKLCDGSVPWVEVQDHAHGNYVTFNERNWYAASNDQWNGVYFNTIATPTDEIKLPPTSQSSPWAVSLSCEIQEPVSNTYQGVYAPDPYRDLYENGTYLRGASLSFYNYPFELVVNTDNGTPSFGLLDYTSPTSVFTELAEDLDKDTSEATVDSVEGIPDPRREFVVISISGVGGDIEYAQVIGRDSTLNVLTLIRGIYGTTPKNWPASSIVNLQGPSSSVSIDKYDYDWSLTKSAMIRFLQVMGYSTDSIAKLLRPRYSSSRNILLKDISENPGKDSGYATGTGPWPMEFSTPSQLDALSHSFHSVGRLNYSSGLPQYVRNNIPVKQYYDYLSTEIWGGVINLTGADEKGNLPTSGEMTEAGVGRPAGTYTSDITATNRIDSGPGESGGGDGGGGVTAVYTGPGLVGGPIFAEGTITLAPPSAGQIGGVKAGDNITIAPDGTISAQASGSGTVQSITFENGLTGGTITTTGSVGVNIGDGLFLNTDGQLSVKPSAGVSAGTGINISAEGAISILPPAGPVIGGVKAGTGVTIAPDGTISVSDAPTAGIVLLDNLTNSFNGTLQSFPLTVGGAVYTPETDASVLISVGGVPQGTPINYNVSGSTITFSSPPPAGASFYGIGLNGSLQFLPTAGLAVVQLDDISAGFNGSQTDFTLKVGGTPYSPTASYFVYIVVGGVVQATPAAYSVTGSTLSFTSAPPAGATFYAVSFG